MSKEESHRQSKFMRRFTTQSVASCDLHKAHG